MPGFDRSGPVGAGPMTGGGRGICGRGRWPNYSPANGGNYGYGRCSGFRSGFGRGLGPRCRGCAYPVAAATGYPQTKAGELEMLRANAEALQRSLQAVQQRIKELDQEAAE